MNDDGPQTATKSPADGAVELPPRPHAPQHAPPTRAVSTGIGAQQPPEQTTSGSAALQHVVTPSFSPFFDPQHESTTGATAG